MLTSVPEATYWLERLLAAEQTVEVEAEALAPGLGLYGQLQAFGDDTEGAVRTLERSLDLFRRGGRSPGSGLRPTHARHRPVGR